MPARKTPKKAAKKTAAKKKAQVVKRKLPSKPKKLPTKRKKRQGAGRPTVYEDDYARQAEMLAREGKSIPIIAAFFGVSQPTIYQWQKEHPAFQEGIRRGRANADGLVTSAVFRRACGYDKKGRHYPPDFSSASFWLRNRRPEEWRDKTEIEANVNQTVNLKITIGASAEVQGRALDGPGTIDV